MKNIAPKIRRFINIHTESIAYLSNCVYRMRYL